MRMFCREHTCDYGGLKWKPKWHSFLILKLSRKDGYHLLYKMIDCGSLRTMKEMVLHLLFASTTNAMEYNVTTFTLQRNWRLLQSNLFHPIHDQSFLTMPEHKTKQKKECGIEPWSSIHKFGKLVSYLQLVLIKCGTLSLPPRDILYKQDIKLLGLRDKPITQQEALLKSDDLLR
ncbi:hypothetical protein GQ457_12G013290 [Hibiscus cannabinus]